MKKACAVVGIMLICVALFSFVSFAAEKENHNDMNVRQLSFYYYNAPNYQQYAGKFTATDSPIHVTVSSFQSSILQLSVDGFLTSYIPNSATSAWIQFDVSVSSEAVKGDDVPPFYGISGVQFLSDISGTDQPTAPVLRISQTDKEGNPYIDVLYSYVDKRGNTRLVDSAVFAEWFMSSDSSDPYINFSFYVKVNNNYLTSFNNVISESNIVRILVDHVGATGGSLDISPVVSMYYTEFYLSDKEQYDQMNELINGDSAVQGSASDLDNQNGQINSDIASIYSEIDYDIFDAMLELDPPNQYVAPGFIAGVMTFFDDSPVLYMFVILGLFTSLGFWILRV